MSFGVRQTYAYILILTLPRNYMTAGFSSLMYLCVLICHMEIKTVLYFMVLV